MVWLVGNSVHFGVRHVLNPVHHMLDQILHHEASEDLCISDVTLKLVVCVRQEVKNPCDDQVKSQEEKPARLGQVASQSLGEDVRGGATRLYRHRVAQAPLPVEEEVAQQERVPDHHRRYPENEPERMSKRFAAREVG